jgi:imidazolonepropionase-like amidohydrolase
MKGAGGPSVILADLLIDGTGREPLADPVIEIEAGRIARIRSCQQDLGRGKEVIDLRGCSIAPGLIDSHVHLALRPELSTDESIAFIEGGDEREILDTMWESAKTAFVHGVTTVRDCGAPGRTGVTLRDRARNEPGMPDILVSGRPVTTRGGHCHWMGLVANSLEEVDVAVRELCAEGVDFIKVMATGGMMTPGSDPYRAQYPEPILEHLVAEAHQRGKRVAAHVLSAPGLRAAIAAGVDTVEHFTTITNARQDVDPALIPEIASSSVIVGVTAHHSLRDLLRAGEFDAIETRLAPHRGLRQAGARTNVHSDAGTPGTYTRDFHESIAIYMIGMKTTVAEAVQAGTATAAAALGIEAEIGTIQSGRRADLIAVEGRLDHQIAALGQVRVVFKDGQPRSTLSSEL